MRWVVLQHCHANMLSGSNLGASTVFFGASRRFLVPARLLNAGCQFLHFVPFPQFLPFAHLQPLCALPALLPLPALGTNLFTWNPTTRQCVIKIFAVRMFLLPARFDRKLSVQGSRCCGYKEGTKAEEEKEGREYSTSGQPADHRPRGERILWVASNCRTHMPQLLY